MKLKLMFFTGVSLVLLSGCLGMGNSSDKSANEKERDEFLLDNDKNGVPDSLEKYAENCLLSVEECLKIAQENKDSLIELLTLESPEANPEGGEFEGTLMVELFGPDSALLFYTLDGSKPNENSLRYLEPILMDSSGVLKAVAYQPGKITSAPISEQYVILRNPLII